MLRYYVTEPSNALTSCRFAIPCVVETHDTEGEGERSGPALTLCVPPALAKS